VAVLREDGDARQVGGHAGRGRRGEPHGPANEERIAQRQGDLGGFRPDDDRSRDASAGSGEQALVAGERAQEPRSRGVESDAACEERCGATLQVLGSFSLGQRNAGLIDDGVANRGSRCVHDENPDGFRRIKVQSSYISSNLASVQAQVSRAESFAGRPQHSAVLEGALKRSLRILEAPSRVRPRRA
jgi:hypothetical protein